MKTKVPDIRPDFDQPNYDSAKIAPYTLEDPLTFVNGTPVKNAKDWARRRREIVNIFVKKMYGRIPPQPAEMFTELVEEKKDALAGYAVRSQYKMFFRKDHTAPVIDWLVLRPRHAKKKVPVILFLNYRGNHELIPDEEIPIPDVWAGLEADHKIPQVRGVMCDPRQNTVLPVGILLAAGYAVMSACYCQVSPDPASVEKEERFSQENYAYRGVFELWGKRDESKRDNPTALGAWAWALSRGLDLAERIPELDVSKSVVTGFSRLGKAALLAASRDERFAVCVPVQCGGGGATLAKRDFGENVATEIKMFRHWYCKKYADYAHNPAKLLDFDQHLLLASIAPRKLLIAGFEQSWFDTEGEYLACKAASPVWKFLGKQGMPGKAFPKVFDTSCIGPDFGYYHRTEEHGIAAFDWLQLLKFAGL